MQIYALNSQGALISSSEAQKEFTYLCPECKNPLRLRGGDLRRLHFYHPDFTHLCRQNGKSETHLALQMHIQQLLLEDCLLERPFNEIGRIADCFWISKKQVIEIQCSMITGAEIAKRTKDYESLGLRVLWILHERTFNKKRVTQAEAFLRSYPHFFTNFNERGQGVIYRQKSQERGGFRIEWGLKEVVDLRELPAQKNFWTTLMDKFFDAKAQRRKGNRR
jgi:competence protein CoiA